MISFNYIYINSLRPSDAIWRHWSGSTWAQVMAYCLTAQSHYLNQCWLNINGVLWYLPYNNFTDSAWDISSWFEFQNYIILKLRPNLPGAHELRPLQKCNTHQIVKFVTSHTKHIDTYWTDVSYLSTETAARGKMYATNDIWFTANNGFGHLWIGQSLFTANLIFFYI